MWNIIRNTVIKEIIRYRRLVSQTFRAISSFYHHVTLANSLPHAKFTKQNHQLFSHLKGIRYINKKMNILSCWEAE